MNLRGKQYLIDFGMAKAKFDFQNETSLTFTILEKEGINTDTSETVVINITELRPQLLMVTWQEKSGTTVTQVQDYENGILYSNWTSADGDFKHAKGSIKKIDE